MPGNKPHQSATGRGRKTPGVALFQPLGSGIFLAEEIQKRHRPRRGSPPLLNLVWWIPGERFFRPLRLRTALRPEKPSGDKGPGLLLRVIRVREKTPGKTLLAPVASGASGGTGSETLTRYIPIPEPPVFLRERTTLPGVLSPPESSSLLPSHPPVPEKRGFSRPPRDPLEKESLRLVREGSPGSPVIPSGGGSSRKEITRFLETVQEKRDPTAPVGGGRRENFTLLWRVRRNLLERERVFLARRESFPGAGPGFTSRRGVPGEDSQIFPVIFLEREKRPGEKGSGAVEEGLRGGEKLPLSLIYARPPRPRRDISGEKAPGRVPEVESSEDLRPRPSWPENGGSCSTFTLSLPEIRHLVEILFEPFMERWRRELRKRGYLHVRFP